MARVIWHFEAHRHFGESLAYYFVNFLGSFNREKAYTDVAKLLAREGVETFSLYELFGEYDLAIKAWQPGMRSLQLERLLVQNFRGHHAFQIRSFFVVENPLHWRWKTDADPKGLRALSLSKIEEIQEQLCAKDEDFSYADYACTYVPAEGIKVFITIPEPNPRLLIPSIDDEFTRQVVSLVESAEELRDYTAYRGIHFGCLLVECTISETHYEKLSYLVYGLNELAGRFFENTTSTFLVASRRSEHCLERHETISTRTRRHERQLPDALETYLERPESETFEAKASLTLDVSRYLKTGESKTDKKLAEGVLKSVVALLNGDGGEVLVGALESSRVPKNPKVDLSNLAKGAQWTVLGVEAEFGANGWDEFAKKLADLSSAHINSSAATLMKAFPLRLGERTLALISVPEGDRWYYLDGKRFFVRVGPSTRELKGREQEEYQAQHPRTGSESSRT